MKTERLYYKDMELAEFRTSVMEIRKTPEKGILLRLAATAFYPEGGGQPADRGTLGDIPVVHVSKNGGEIWHLLEVLPETASGPLSTGMKLQEK